MKERLFTLTLALILLAIALELHRELPLAYGLLALIGVLIEIGSAVFGLLFAFWALA